MADFVYSIEGFRPPSEDGVCRWGFSAVIDRELARKARETEVSDEIRAGLLKFGNEAIRRVFGRDFSSWELCGEVYNFSGESLLLHYCSVPGDRCTLGMNSGEFEFGRGVEYQSHNVDNAQQAYALLALWTRWANGVNIYLQGNV